MGAFTQATLRSRLGCTRGAGRGGVAWNISVTASYRVTSHSYSMAVQWGVGEEAGK